MNWDDAAFEYYEQTVPHHGRLSSLPATWQREMVALRWVCRDVCNGGYLQFLANHGRETYEYASRALRLIGARRMAEIVDQCQALIDEHFLSAGLSSDERAQLLPNPIIGEYGQCVKEPGSVLPEVVQDRIRELSYEFMGFPEDVGPLAQSHFGPLIEADKSS